MKKMNRNTKEMIGGCCVCSDERGWSENPLVYCDGHGCNVAVHQACYGIVQVPTGPWFCKKCESQERIARVKCELCPQRDGALKRTKSGGWCHVVCALYIPEACFDNVQTMEPIVLSSVPQERFNKTCYICEEQKRDTKATAGACMQCNRNGCKQYFHVTCAQAQGLLCEVTGSYENVKYCGYCSHHYKKLKNLSNVKTIPAFRPIPNDNETPDSSPEKNPPVISDEGKKKSKSDPSVETAVKSPQVDQSVSSTSDSLPPTLVPSIKTDPTLPSSSTSLSGNSGETSDSITSAVSPSQPQVDDVKNPTSEQQIQEPSSSVVTAAPKSTKPQLTDLMIQDGSATSSTENLFDVDVTSSPPPLEKAEPHPVVKKPAVKKSKLKPDTVPKKPRLGNSDKPTKLSGKKSKHNVTSTSASTSNSGGVKDTVRKQGGGSKKSRHLSGSTTKSQSSASSTSKAAASQGHTTLPWHHDYCSSSSNNVFGGSPYFQSLSAPGHINLPSFSSSSVFLSNMPNSSGRANLLYGDANRQQHGDPCEGKGSMPNLIPPLKMFPNPLQETASKNNFPLTMEHLLEQQWEAGANFLMEQSEHFDISSLLNCLHHYKSDIRQLEDEVRDLTSQRDHLMAINARLSVPLAMLDSSPLTKNNSAWASLEDISSPDEAVEKPIYAPTLKMSDHSNYAVEDIVSPAEPVPPSSTRSKFTFSDQMYPPPHTLMHSALNPPPSTLSGNTAPPLSVSAPLSLSLSSTNPSSFKSSFIPFVPGSSTITTSSSSTSLSSSNPSMPLLEPSLNNLHLSNQM